MRFALGGIRVIVVRWANARTVHGGVSPTRLGVSVSQNCVGWAQRQAGAYANFATTASSQ